MPFISVLPIESQLCSLFLNPEAIEKLGVKPGENIMIRAGSSVLEASVTGDISGNFISQMALKKLNLPITIELKLISTGTEGLRLGPLVGIIISRSKKHRLPPYSPQKSLLKLFVNYGTKQKCLVYTFSPKGVDMENRLITGYYIETDENGEKYWKKHSFPLPDVVYDRIMYRSVEWKALTRKTAKFLSHQENITWFNSKFLSKWETHQVLHKNPQLQVHLPETKKYEGSADLVNFLAA
jgi:hypothetical protein